MDRFPEIDVYFPGDREAELREQIDIRMDSPWSLQAGDYPDYVGYHRARLNDIPSCVVWFHRKGVGHWQSVSIVPDTTGQMSAEEIRRVLGEFMNLVEPAVEVVKGNASMGIDRHLLTENFTRQAVGLLEAYCKAPGDGYGTHACDQERWIRFLLQAYDDAEGSGRKVSGDVFGSCLRNAAWYSDDEIIRRLVHEYDFAMRLLKQTGR